MEEYCLVLSLAVLLSMLIAQETLRDALVNAQASVYEIYEELISRGQLVMVKLIKAQKVLVKMRPERPRTILWADLEL